MPIRFAPARHRNLVAAMAVRKPGGSGAGFAANDNLPPAANDERPLCEALRHFGHHGLSAATIARDYALAAHAAGDSPGYSRWRSICGMLDSRLARTLADSGFER